MTNEETTGTFEPLTPPYYQISDANRGPLVVLAAVIWMIITGLVVIVRVYITVSTTRKGKPNDVIMIAAMALAIGYTISISMAVQYGLGRVADNLDESRTDKLGQTYYISNILLIFALASAKASVILLIISFRPLRLVMQASYGVLGFVTLWSVVSAFLVALQCSPKRWVLGPTEHETCIDQYAMQVAIRASDVASDIAIVLLPVFMMRPVKVTRKEKWTVIMLFSLRLITPIVTVVSIATLSDFYDASVEDRPHRAVTLSIWTSAALNLSIVTACIPSIKRFLADWAVGLSTANISEPFEHEHSAGKSQSHPYAQGSGFGRSIATKLGFSVSSRGDTSSRSRGGDPDRDIQLQNHTYSTRKALSSPSDETSDSVKGLTDDVIMQTTEFKVEYVDSGSHVRDCSMSSDGREEHAYNRYERRM